MSQSSARAHIPVVMYHGVGRPDPTWPWHPLTVKWTFFDRQLGALREAGYRAITLAEFYERQAAGHPPNERLLVLTFDDGYLDNWVYAVPIMRRHGMRGTVYVNPDFMDPGKSPRPTLDSIGTRGIAEDDLPIRGFMNAAELRAGVDAGLLEIGCHSRTHTWYPMSPRIIDYHRPGAWYPWLAWNARPDRKHAYLTEDQSAFLPWGTPVYESGRSLGIRRYFPDPGISDTIIDHVQRNGGAAFFGTPCWQRDLASITENLSAETGRYESDAEMQARFHDEILASRVDLETRLGVPVDHFAWPGGSYTDSSWAIAAASRYTTLAVSPHDKLRWRLTDPHLMRRLSCHSRLSLLGRSFPNTHARALLHACEAHRGIHAHRHFLRVYKILAALAAPRPLWAHATRRSPDRTKGPQDSGDYAG